MATKVEGIPEWGRALDLLMDRVDQVTARATADSALLVEREGMLQLRRSAHPYGTPTPSPRGAPPAWVSGFLSRSWHSTGSHVVGLHRYSAQSGPTAVYSRIQELGGMAGRNHRTYVPYRPYVLPASVRAREPVRDLFQRRWAEVIERG